MSVVRDLRLLLRGRDFRRLFSVRVASQLSDGVFQVALASYVLFSPERQASPGAIAGAFAAVLLPFSVLGPFTGVFIDRWSRRQILAWSNFVRVVLLLVVGAVIAAGTVGPVLFVAVLVTLSVNRFLLAALSAALPHVVDVQRLVMANSVTPTCGTAAFLVGLAGGALLREAGEAMGGPPNV
ncbi:MAG: MFS transporter, partial [Thermocrispum sp.]